MEFIWFPHGNTTTFPAIALGISMKSISKSPSRRPVFHPKIMPFLCPENAPQKCKWLQCVRLVINKRRPSPDVAAAPQRHPRASRSGTDQAHTLPRANRPLNYSIFYRTKAPKTWTLRDEKRGGERSRPRWTAQDRLPLFPAAYAFLLHFPIPYLSMLSVFRIMLIPLRFCFFGRLRLA